MRAKVLLHRGEEQFGEGRLSFFAETWNSDRKQKTEVASIPVDWQKEEQEFELPLGDEAQLWSEFHPALYRLTLSLETAQGKDVQQADFGLRDFRAEGKHFTINGNTTFLRGKVVFPLMVKCLPSARKSRKPKSACCTSFPCAVSKERVRR